LNNDTLNNVEKAISNGNKAAIGSFLTGTFILLFYYFTHYNSIIYFALFFCMAAFIINGFLFIELTIELFKKSILKNKIMKTLLLMLLNIPIGFGYFEIGFHIYSTATPN
jgi:hypothetical protein